MAFVSISAFADHAVFADVPIGGVFYEIFVRSFQDSDGDGIGDLDGVTARLDYLSGLGIDGIWLTPIFPSPSYHGYDATDYMSVADVYGGMPALQRLLAGAHQRGMVVFLDIAINHTSNQHPWFLDSKSGTSSSLRDRYLWSDHDPDWSEAIGHWYQLSPENLYYSTFSQYMPDLNWRDPGTLPEVEKILTFWKEQGVDGFRLDAARYYVKGPEGEADMPETHEAIQEFAQATRDGYPGTFFVGEIWAEWDTIFPYINSGSELDSAFAFPLAFSLIDSLKEGTPESLTAAIAELANSGVSADHISPIITNHDMDRASTQLELDRRRHGRHRKKKKTATGREQLTLAATLLLTLPGTPFLYYGEEIGMGNGRGSAFPGDYAKRTPMQWTTDPNHGFTPVEAHPWLGFSSDNPDLTVESQTADSTSLLQAYQTLISIRHGSTALRGGTLENVTVSDSSHLLAFLRRSASDGTLALVVGNFTNSSTAPATIKISSAGDVALTAQALWGPPGSSIEQESGQAVVTVPSLPPWGSLIISLGSSGSLESLRHAVH
jgi:alpha-amylase